MSYSGVPPDPDQSRFATATDLALSNAPCFAAGTRIQTDRGEVAVEQLVVGDLLVTAAGVFRPIVWIGMRRVDCRRHPFPAKVAPICVRAHAFGRNRPRRNLILSPDHAIFAQDVLIPVKYLINGATIRPIDVPAVRYFHVELAEHAVILAEGLQVESYLDTGDRLSFENGGAALVLHPTFGAEPRAVMVIAETLGCAPLRTAGAEVEHVRARLAKRAAVSARVLTHRPPQSQ
jgi:collagen type I alpha